MAASVCRGCGEAFTGVGPFDTHHKDIPTPPFVKCVDPSTLGLVKDKHDRWGAGGGAEIENTYIPADERPARDYEVECRDCGKLFERPRRRGRPPVKCPTCKEL